MKTDTHTKQRLIELSTRIQWDCFCDDMERSLPPLKDLLETWGKHCGAPYLVFRGQLCKAILDIWKMEEEAHRTRRYSYDDMLDWRGISTLDGDKPCSGCLGSGLRLYGNTSTWKGGIGGARVTKDICDKCWGSGCENRPWTNLRKLKGDNRG